MKDQEKTKEQLIEELVELRQRIAELEASETARRRAEEALRESEQQLSTTLRSIGDAVIATDAKGLVTLINPVAEDLTGWDEAEAVGQPLEEVFNIINEQTGERAENPVARVLRQGVVVGLANHRVLIAKDGTKRPIADSGAPMRDEEGKIIGTVMVFHDLSERREAERAAREAREYAEGIVGTVREPLVVLNADLRVVSASRSFYQSFQATPEETEGQLLYDLGNRQWDIPKLRELLEEILPENTVFDGFEVEHDFPTIGRRAMFLNGRRICREADEAQMILLAIEDITERKRAEEELRQYRDYLEDLVEQRTAELQRTNEELEAEVAERVRAEEKLKTMAELEAARTVALNMMADADEARRMAEQANEDLKREIAERVRAEEKLKQTMADLERSNKELEQFAYVASHDLQEPLRMVASYTQLLGRRYQSQLDADADDFIAYAVDGANRMQRLINDLLAYSRVGMRGKPFEPTDCNHALGQALVNLSAAIRESNALVPNDELPTVMADEAQLVQLFQNLIGNAIKFRSEELPHIRISAQRMKDSEIPNLKSESRKPNRGFSPSVTTASA